MPAFSVVVVIVSDTTRSRYDTAHLEGTLDGLARQIAAPPLEIIVPYAPPLDGVDRLARRYPDVHFAPITDLASYDPVTPGREHHEELRARGLALATGSIVGILEDHDRPDPHWAARMLEAHRQPYAAVGGAIENGIDHPLNWAVYFCDFGRYQNPLHAGESDCASDANSSYKRAALEAVRHAWRDSFHETTVNQALLHSGRKLTLAPGAIVYQHRLDLRFGDTLHERYLWGRSYGISRCAVISPVRRFAYAACAGLLPPLLVLRIAGRAIARRRTIPPMLQALPLIMLLTIAWVCGEFVGYLKGCAAAAPAARVQTQGAG